MMDSLRKSAFRRRFPSPVATRACKNQWFCFVGTETDHVISAVFVNGFKIGCDINYFPICKVYIITDQCEIFQFMHQPLVENTLVSIHSVPIPLSYNISCFIHNRMSPTLDWIQLGFAFGTVPVTMNDAHHLSKGSQFWSHHQCTCSNGCRRPCKCNSFIHQAIKGQVKMPVYVANRITVTVHEQYTIILYHFQRAKQFNRRCSKIVLTNLWQIR
mmetsp:Transcript_2319/g.2704  ORF Transcript_2319/g.2704 Transcript_2319/m.2704 type:complete len:215 (+) Transcript_2319:402-1046(+)